MMVRKIILFSLLFLLIQCNKTKKIIDWDERVSEWRESIPSNSNFYQTIVSVPMVDVRSENLKKSENEAKAKFAETIQGEISRSVLWKQLNLSEKQIQSMERSMNKTLIEEISHIVFESSFSADHDFHAAYKLDKTSFNDDYNSKKQLAINKATTLWNEGKAWQLKNESQKSADSFCAALISIQNYLGQTLTNFSSPDLMDIDQKIINSMQNLRKEMSIKIDPADTIKLNQENDHIGLLNFEVHQSGIKSGNINVAVDVASIRQDILMVNGYSVLINDLPMKLRNPFVKISSDLFQNLRLNGNEMVQIIYQQLPAIMSKVRIVREFQSVYIDKNESGFWEDRAYQLLHESLKNSEVKILDEQTNDALILNPKIIVSKEEGHGFCTLTANWIVAINGDQESIKGVRLTATGKSERDVQDDILNRLNEQMKRVLNDDILRVISGSKSK